MAEYLRPVFERGVFYDPDGAVIDYGNRWRGGLPPENLYSIEYNPQLFAPLYTLGDALIAHLTQTFEVTVTEGPVVALDLMHDYGQVEKAVRLVPSIDDAAPLTFVFTSYPGLVLHAGLLKDFPYPTCGCEACDETPELLAEEIEERVFGVAAGGFSEIVRLEGERGVGYALRRDKQWSRGFHPALSYDFPSERIRAAERRLSAMPNGWQPWPRRTKGAGG